MSDQYPKTFECNGYVIEKSAGQLMKEVTEDLSTLFRKEIELAKQEIGESVKEKLMGAALVAIAGVFAFFALIFVLLFVRDLFTEWWAPWISDLATAGVLLLFGAGAVFFAKNKLTKPITADKTKQTIKDDVEMMKSLGRNN